ncbi:unnamed protein product [Paramecium sonneborni]|uniref:Uncharacterized protein n=1 Tax=Paramecium sonneborni TaxID=65129 RepID=A0A8S1RF85_9CILI|nr:unnamed protein product [Paramecium sonneborni]
MNPEKTINKPKKESQNLKNSFKYQLLADRSKHYESQCSTIIINQQNNILIVPANNGIILYQFKQGYLKQIKTIKICYKIMSEIQFFKKGSHFITCSYIYINSVVITLWPTNLLSNPKYTNKLIEHTQMIYCLVTLSQEFITGAKDGKIKFWAMLKSWLCLQTINEHSKSISGLCINQDGNRLISSGEDNIILFMERSNLNIWEVKQKIPVKIFSLRMTFITNDVFSFSLAIYSINFFYSYDQSTQQFLKTKELKYSNKKCQYVPHFQQIYIPQKQILVSKLGSKVYLIKFAFQSNIKFKCKSQQVIKFKLSDAIIYGTMTSDGEYLITWDIMSQQIQIRQYKSI